MKNIKLDKNVKEYVLSCISSDDYQDTDGNEINIKDAKDSLAFLYKTFNSEYGWSIKRYGEYKAFQEWIMGLPSSFNIAFTNYDILQLAYKWGSLKETDTDSRKYKIISNWFTFITVKTFQLFRKYKITN